VFAKRIPIGPFDSPTEHDRDSGAPGMVRSCVLLTGAGVD
jgi:hypothetical protein